MKVKDITRQTTDTGLYFEIIEDKGGASFGFYKKNELIYLEKYMNATIKNINFQYINNKRLIVLKVGGL